MSRTHESSMPPELRERLEEEHPNERAGLARVWTLLGRVAPPFEAPEASDTWAAIEAHLDDASAAPPLRNGHVHEDVDRSARRADRTTRSSSRARQSSASTWTSATVAVVVLLALSVWLWQRPVTVSAPAGTQQTATLPDGSTVELNSGSSVSYRRAFQSWPLVDAARRTVRLDGEAYFDVSHAGRPFVVETFNARVEVLGTSFNVRARSGDAAATQVTVTSGQVRVSSPQHPDRSVVLATPGESSRVTGDVPTPPSTANLDRALVWRKQGFAVTDQPLPAVVRELERRYDVTITLHPSVDRQNGALSLYYPQRTEAETVIRDLCLARGLEYRPTSRGFEIYDDAPTGAPTDTAQNSA